MLLIDFVKRVARISLTKLSYSFGNKYSDLKRFKNKYEGKRIFIVATGPSLTPEDLDLLKNEYTFSMNSIFKIYDRTEWRPTFYCIADGGVYERIKEDLAFQSFNCSFVNNLIPWNDSTVIRLPIIPTFCNTEKLRQSLPYWFKKARTASNIEKGIHMGSSVVHVITQLCFYMGFSEIYYIGADCSNFTQHTQNCEHKLEISRPEDSLARGLQEDYFSDYSFAKSHGIKIYNATRGGKLEVFERVDLDLLFD